MQITIRTLQYQCLEKKIFFLYFKIKIWAKINQGYSLILFLSHILLRQRQTKNDAQYISSF